MEISGMDASAQTAALAQTLQTQNVQSQIVMEMLKKMQEMELQMMQSLGKAMNVDIKI
ncbi:MAG: hypothetical protein WCX65_02375 [bacterium]